MTSPLFQAQFGGSNPDFDLDEPPDGLVGATDQAILLSFFGASPGPSGVSQCEPDTDLDGVPDSVDNCTDIANPSQNDSNGDGFGNRCDPDFDQDCFVDNIDNLHIRIVQASESHDPDFDLDEPPDGLVMNSDRIILESFLHKPPGPSATGCTPPSVPVSGYGGLVLLAVLLVIAGVLGIDATMSRRKAV